MATINVVEAWNATDFKQAVNAAEKELGTVFATQTHVTPLSEGRVLYTAILFTK